MAAVENGDRFELERGALDCVVVANRGEIAVRVMRTLRTMGIRSVAVFTAADRGALHVEVADVAVEIASYLSVDDVIAAATRTGATAIHPGYGFLSENPALARACDGAGILFVGPPASAIEAMGDKIAAKARVASAGVPVVPGSDRAGMTDDELTDAATEVGFPVLIKPSAGGGGKGMRLVHGGAELAAAIESARREARSSFGDDTLLVERFVSNPRHIEIQVLADRHGNVVHLGERECSLQRRHQKIVEEAPSPLLTPDQRSAMGAQAVQAARACGYVGAGTVEFIVSSDRPDEFFFMEMNTRLQVEHPVTEMVYGVDLVEQQIKVAMGEPLDFVQGDLSMDGHAIEARVYAEDPSRGFLPTGGTVEKFEVPGGTGIRVDSGIRTGSVVGSSFDPMLAKVIAWGANRAEALDRLDQALAQSVVMGVTTNIGFVRRLLADQDVRAGRLDTGLVERRIDELADKRGPNAAAALMAAAVVPFAVVAPDAKTGPWDRLTGWRLGGVAAIRREFDVGSERIEVLVRPQSDRTWSIESAALPASQAHVGRRGDDRYELRVDGVRYDVTLVDVGSVCHVAIGGDSWTFSPVVHRGGGAAASAGDAVVRSPMPGTVVSMPVAAGESVSAGQTVAVVEAMKMEHALVAPFDGTVGQIHVANGAQVTLDQPLLTVEAPDG